MFTVPTYSRPSRPARRIHRKAERASFLRSVPRCIWCGWQIRSREQGVCNQFCQIWLDETRRPRDEDKKVA